MIVEIKARFDEQANIRWARKLEQAGCHVVYGLVGLKTHCKLAMVVRDEPEGIRRYTHIGTGNYNPKTARMYEDFGLLTTDEAIGEDIAHLFNNLSGYRRNATYERAAGRARLGAQRAARPDRRARSSTTRPGGRRGSGSRSTRIVDEAIIDALYRASQAGVQVELWCAASARCGRACPGCPRTSRSARSSAGSSSTAGSSGSRTAASRRPGSARRT